MAILENDKLQKFEDQSIRTAWDEEQEEWYFSSALYSGNITLENLSNKESSEGCFYTDSSDS